MLSAKPWKFDAIVRLVLGVILCMFAGSLIMSALQCLHTGPKAAPKFFLLAASAFIFIAATLVLLLKEWSPENLLRRLVLLLICFYFGMFLGAWAQRIIGPALAPNAVQQMIVATLSLQGATIVLVVFFVRQHRVSWNEAFSFSNAWPNAVLFGAAAGFIFLPIGSGLQWASMELMQHVPHFPIQPVEQQAVQTLRIAVFWTDRLTLGTVTILVAPLAEELLFRGILYPWIKQAGFPRFAWFGTSLLFAAIHTNAATFLPLFVLALVLTWLYEKTNNLLAPICAHALFNGLNFARLYWLEKGLGS